MVRTPAVADIDPDGRIVADFLGSNMRSTCVYRNEGNVGQSGLQPLSQQGESALKALFQAIELRRLKFFFF
jgi:hypothetical protein